MEWMKLSSKASTIHFLGNLIKGSTCYSKNTYKLWHARLLYLLEEKERIQTSDGEEIHFITWAVGSYWLYHPELGRQCLLHSGGTCRWPVLSDRVLWSCRVPLRLGTDWLSCSSEPYNLHHKLSISQTPHVGFKHIFLVLPRVLPKCWDSSLSRNVLRSVRPHFQNVWTAVVSTGGEDTRGSSFADALALLTIYKHLLTALFSSSESSLYRRLVGSGQIHWESKQQNLQHLAPFKWLLPAY